MGQQSWIEDLPHRFDDDLESGILYRPEIVDEIVKKVEENLSKQVKRGLMIKGPQGIGKSHSIVSVVRNLQSTGNYLVTFIPDCENWGHIDDLINVICGSIGTTATALGIPQSGNNREVLLQLIEDVTKVLMKTDKQWVFVFDQINRLFARFQDRNDVGVLDFPYSLIKQVMSPGRITSIISASANNAISYKEHHGGFDEYIHRTDMTNEEIKLVFPNATNYRKVKKWTGNVPLYAHKFVVTLRESAVRFREDTLESINQSIQKLTTGSTVNKDELYQSMSRILLHLDFDSIPTVYDRKFFFKMSDRNGLTALFPLAERAWRKILTEFLFTFVSQNEADLLSVYQRDDTTNDTKGRLFESIVIHRCKSAGVIVPRSVIDADVTVPAKCTYFETTQLPAMIDDGVYIPRDPNFPAVDMVWKSDKRVFGVQVHISSNHKDVAAPFLKMCREKKWLELYKEVYLLYLSPSADSAMKNQPNFYPPPTDSRLRKRKKTKEKQIVIRNIAIDSLPCMDQVRRLLVPSL